jgi:hypothetical protein
MINSRWKEFVPHDQQSMERVIKVYNTTLVTEIITIAPSASSITSNFAADTASKEQFVPHGHLLSASSAQHDIMYACVA